MHYPLINFAIFSDLNIKIPDPEKIRPMYEKLKLNDVRTLFPFWAKCWPSSLAMLSFLQNNPHYINQKVLLEFGAGIGLPSFFAAKTASSVVISDFAKEAVELMQLNIDTLGYQNVKALQLDWNSCKGEIEADLLLLSDVNYDDNDFDSLKLLLNHYLQTGATILLASPYRINAGAFINHFSDFIQSQELIPVKADTEEVLIGIFTLRKS